MKKLIFLTVISLASITTFAQISFDAPLQTISTDSAVVYRLFATKNMYTFIKLNTRNGQMWQVHWGAESTYRFQNILSDISRVEKGEERNGRFFLYPTANLYEFILIDQIDGREWQVQWSNNPDERTVDPIINRPFH